MSKASRRNKRQVRRREQRKKEWKEKIPLVAALRLLGVGHFPRMSLEGLQIKMNMEIQKTNEQRNTPRHEAPVRLY